MSYEFMKLRDRIFAVLKDAYPALRLLEDEWYIIGTSGLVLAGVKLEKTSDIDILTSVRDAEKLKIAWKNRMRKDFDSSNTELFESDFSRYDFGTLDIEIMGGLKVNHSGKWIPLTISDHLHILTSDFEIRVPTLEEQKKILLLFGREKDLKKIKLLG
ncbi:hypothetical protein FACS1894203_4670 [Bacteroidia bacterium]|nr:hypothetical protein FACS1894203_4670 [Bacteroidia bacterium]GHT71748.1 hypothetical protein FACS189455_4250 [Bacteroidia bacterium]GHU88006.1 hypothetical protein FACS1894155_02040 [Bacteroidia bacterium]